MTRAAVVTGAAGALGSAIAERLGRNGMAVLLVDRDGRVEDVARDLTAGGHPAAAVTADLAEDDPAATILAALDREAWTPHVLVNNAGMNRDARARRMTDDDFAAVVHVDLVAPAKVAEAVAAKMAHGGSIVNVASRAALGGFGQANYVAAKAGLIGLTRAHALEWAPRLRVNAVAPGLVDTPMTAGMPAAVLSRQVDRIPAARMGTAAEIAETVAFLCSPSASYVTGQVLLACGGRSVA